MWRVRGDKKYDWKKQVHLSGWQNGAKYMRKLYDDCHNYIQDITAFGWQPTQESTESHGRTIRHYQIMPRELSMEVDYRWKRIR